MSLWARANNFTFALKYTLIFYPTFKAIQHFRSRSETVCFCKSCRVTTNIPPQLGSGVAILKGQIDRSIRRKTSVEKCGGNWHQSVIICPSGGCSPIFCGQPTYGGLWRLRTTGSSMTQWKSTLDPVGCCNFGWKFYKAKNAHIHYTYSYIHTHIYIYMSIFLHICYRNFHCSRRCHRSEVLVVPISFAHGVGQIWARQVLPCCQVFLRENPVYTNSNVMSGM
jgi:hypothetical protein